MKINQTLLAILIIAVMSGFVITSSALGLWQTSSTKVPAKYESGAFKGEYNPDDIRGSYTFGEISNLFKIPLDDLGKAFAISDENKYAAFQCKELEAIYTSSASEGKEVGTVSVKLFIALYKGLPITLTETTYFPETVNDILLTTGKLTEVQKSFLSSHLVAVQKSNSSVKSEVIETESFIKGKTTFKEILAVGVKKEDIESILGFIIENTSETIKDFCTKNNLSFSDVKTEIQQVIDEK